MTITWMKNIDVAFAEAAKTGRHVFADFNAAPM